MKRWQFWLGIFISLFFLYVALRGLHLGDIWETVRSANYWWLLPGILVYFVAVWVRAWRWHFLIRPLKNVPTRTMFPITTIGYMGNNIYPARAGELLRAVVLNIKEGVAISASLATVIVERLFDGVVMLGFVFLNLPELGKLTAFSGLVGSIQSVAVWGATAFIGALLVFLLVAIYPAPATRLANWFIERFVPGKWRAGTSSLASRFLSGLESLRSPYEVMMVLLTSLIIWLLETSVYWLVLQAFPIQGVNFFALMLMNGIVNLATTLPSTPGYIGTFDAPGIALLQAYGVNGALAAGFTLVLHATLWLPITLVGAYFFLKEGLNLTSAVQSAKDDQRTAVHKKKIAIIGGGVGGMTAAYELAKHGHQVTLLEASDHLGGLSGGFRKKGWKWSLESYYHHWFQGDRDVLGLINELELKDQVRFYKPKTVVYHDGQFDPLDSPLAALLFPGFNLLDKARFGFVTLYLRYLSRWQSFEKYTAYEWLRKFYGKRLYELMYQPLLEGKFGPYYKQVNMAWFWARFKVRSTQLGTFEGGFQRFIDLFTQALKKHKVRVELNTAVSSIRRTKEGLFQLDMVSKPGASYDQVLVTTSPQALVKLAPGIKGDYLAKLKGLKSIGAQVLILSLKRPLSTQGYYWFNLPKSAGFPFLALVEHTNFLSTDHYNGEHIIYCGDYLDPQHPYFKLDKDKLAALYLPSLKRINPDFEPAWMRDSWLVRDAYAQPVPLVNQSARLPELQTPIAGLFFASMSQVYPWDRGTNYAVQLARQVVELMEKPGDNAQKKYA